MSERQHDRRQSEAVSRSASLPRLPAHASASSLILADTEELHARIEQLEKALAVSHAKAMGSVGIGTSEAHPLLLNTYLFSPRVKSKPLMGGTRGSGALSSPLAEGSRAGKPYSPTERDSNRVKVKTEQGEDDERLEEISLGTLTIGSNGEAVFVGASAGSNYLHVKLRSRQWQRMHCSLQLHTGRWTFAPRLCR